MRGRIVGMMALLFVVVVLLQSIAAQEPKPLTAEQRQALEAEARRLLEQAQKLDGEGKLAEAVQVGERMLTAVRQLLKNQDPAIANVLEWLASRYTQLEQFTAAIKCREEVVAILSEQWGQDHWQVINTRWVLKHTETLAALSTAERRQLDAAVARNSDAVRLYGEVKYAEATRAAQEAGTIYKAMLGENHPAYANVLNILAELCRSQGDYVRAKPLYHQVLEIRRKTLGEYHPDYAASLHGLAFLSENQGDYAQAVPLYRQALEVHKKALGENHPDYATSLHNLGGLYFKHGDHARAEPLLRQALEIRKKVLGENHPDYAQSLNNLAFLYYSQRDYARAEPLFRQALEIRKELLGANHSDYAASLNNLAFLYDSQGDYTRAEPLYRQSLDIYKQTLGESHPDYAVSLNNLASLYYSQGDYTRAEPLYRQALDIYKQALGENHPRYATGLNNLAALYRSQGDYARAEPLYRQALDITLHNLDLAAVIQSERQQLAMSAACRHMLDNYLALAVRARDFGAAVYERLLAWKGAVLARQQALREISARPELTPLAMELQKVARQLAGWW